MPVFQTKYEYKRTFSEGDMTTKAIPDESYTVRDLLHRFSHGLPLPQLDSVGGFEENPDLDFATSDYGDKLEELQNSRDVINNYSAQMSDSQKENPMQTPPPTESPEKNEVGDEN